jgi:argininosuccinate synthase
VLLNKLDAVIDQHMLSDKPRSDKVETIKNLIRKNNYKNSDKTYMQCMEYGISVNLNSLSRFSEKLELLDRAVRTKRLDKLHQEKNHGANMMTYEQVKHRETEITFELGELRVKENRLMDELNKLSIMLDSKQFN